MNLSSLDNYLKDRAQQDRFSGVVLLTQGQTVLFQAAYGHASRAWKIPNTLDTRFDTASITKLLTAVATLQLIDADQLTLETRVIELLGLTATALSQEITVYHLLTHTSGIGDDADEEAGESYEDIWKTKPNYAVTSTLDFLPQFIHKPPNFAPGAGCRYCNCGYVLLGLVIEKITGMPYREYVQTHIFAKAGMAQSGFFRMNQVVENVAEGCDPILDMAQNITGWKRNIYSYPPIGSPDGGAHLTVGDLDRFLRAVQAGEMLSPTLTTAFLTPHVFHSTKAEQVVKFGYGLEFVLDSADKVLYYEKEGINVGVSGIIRHYPDDDLNVILLSNMMEGVWQPIRHIHEIVTRAASAPAK